MQPMVDDLLTRGPSTSNCLLFSITVPYAVVCKWSNIVIGLLGSQVDRRVRFFSSSRRWISGECNCKWKMIQLNVRTRINAVQAWQTRWLFEHTTVVVLVDCKIIRRMTETSFLTQQICNDKRFRKCQLRRWKENLDNNRRLELKIPVIVVTFNDILGV